MKNLLIIVFTISAQFVFSASAIAQNNENPSQNQQLHKGMDHSTHMLQGKQHFMPTAAVSTGQLTESGNDIFATIQEVVNQLLQDNRTDWSRVDIEALRQHLIDMENFTVNVEILSQTNIEGGVEIVLKPTLPQAEGSLDRALSAHPAMLKQEVGWIMNAKKSGHTYTITITSTNPTDVAKIRALGYVGAMVMGNHHQPHHWAMATGANPHAAH
ncbi:hypothetical protein ACFL17_09500 [Pseudomonadota bacterium]